MRTTRLHLRSRIALPAALCTALLLPAPLARAAADRAQFERPVMMDSDGPGSELYVLDDAGTLHAFRVSENGLSEYSHVSVPAGFTAADMTFARSEKPASVLFAGSRSGRGLVIQLGLDGKQVKAWDFQNICAGVDSGAFNHAAYVATSDSNEIYEVDLKKSRISLVAHISEASKLGPVAFDEARQEIYVADLASGRVYLYSLAAKTTKVFVTGLSAPTALAFDAETNRLFVADPGQRSVFTVDTRASKPTLALFAAAPLRAPYGMTLISAGRVAVADYSANAVFVFSGKGDLLFRYPVNR